MPCGACEYQAKDRRNGPLGPHMGDPSKCIVGHFGQHTALEPFSEGGGASSGSANQGEAAKPPEDQSGEVSGMRARPQPRQPTLEEIASHNIDHYPYRSWCRPCVAAMGRADQHVRGSEDDGIAVVSMDYGFFSDSTDRELLLAQANLDIGARKNKGEEKDGATPILIIRDKRNKMIFGDVVTCKGAQDVGVVNRAVQHIEQCGHPEIMIRSDGEPAIKSLRNAVKTKLLEKGIRVVPNATPTADSAGAGTAESAVKLIKDKTRVLVCWAREHHGVTMKSNHNLLPWAVQYAGQLLNRAHKGEDGLTAYQRSTGKRELPRKYAAWGEKVLWLEGSKKKAQAGEKWHDGIFLGLVDESEEAVIGTPNGCFKSRSIRRRTREESKDPTYFNAVIGLPWKMRPKESDDGDQASAPVTLKIDILPSTDELPPMIHGATGQVKRVYIRKPVELKAYGYTGACAGCDAAKADGEPRGHSEACRARIVECMKNDEKLNARVQEAEFRQAIVEVKDDEQPQSKKSKTGSSNDVERQSAAPSQTAGPAPSVADTSMQIDGSGGGLTPATTPMATGGGVRGHDDSREEDPETKRQRLTELSLGLEEFCIVQRAEEERLHRRSSDRDVAAILSLSNGRCLEELGFGCAERRQVQADLMKLGQHDVHVAEVFSPPRVTAMASRFGLTPGLAFDLRTGWDLDQLDQRQKLWKYLKEERPMLIVGSPECKAFCKLQSLNDKTSPQYRRTLRQGLAHMKVMMEIYEWQVSQGRLFLHEQPWGNASWALDMVQRVQSLPGVRVAKCDQCMFGQWAWNHAGEEMKVKKATGFMTNCAEIEAELAVQCSGDHEHQPLIGGRAKWCAQYPPKLVAAIIKGLRRYLLNQGMLEEMCSGPTVEERCPAAAVDFEKVYHDEITGAEIPSKLVEAAMIEEVKYMREMNVYREVTAQWVEEQGLRPVGTRWILVNKGDAKNPFVRARLVAQETKRVTKEDPLSPSTTFAATPPVEALRFMLSRAMTGPRRAPMDELVLGFFDISRAHFHSPARRMVVVKVPKEDTLCKSGFAELLMTMYGTQDAAQCFDNLVEEIMLKLGYEVGVYNPCLYHHPRKGTAVYRHGDDFVVVGTRTQIEDFRVDLGKSLIVKHLGNLGPSKARGDIQEIRCLNRIIRWVCPPYGKGVERIEYEADPRHAEMLIAFCGLKPGSRSVTTPGEKPRPGADDSGKLSPAEHTEYRSNVMRLCYLAADRIELQFAAKELARRMQEPSPADAEGMKRVARFLLKYPRAVQDFPRQTEVPKKIVCYSDSDHAGCLRTRRSSSSTKVFYGNHLLKSSATTQTVTALSSGESEFYAGVKATSIGIGFVSMLKDLGVELEQSVEVKVKSQDNACLEIRADASAGIGIASRRGAGRVRHIATPTLWLQKLIGDKKVLITKVPGADNCADMGTKHLDAATMLKHMKACGYRFVEGKSQIALSAELDQ